MQVPKWTEAGVGREGLSLLACHTRRKCSMETSRYSVKVKIGIKVINWCKVWSIGNLLQLVKLVVPQISREMKVWIKKICYDNPGNVPNKGRNFNTQKFGKMYLFVFFVWLAVIGFRQNYFYILLNFGDFGAKMSFFSLYNQPKTK